jgi:hypothetical protein
MSTFSEYCREHITSGAMYLIVPVWPVREYNPRQDSERRTEVQSPKSMSLTVPQEVKLRKDEQRENRRDRPNVIRLQVAMENPNFFIVITMEIFDGGGEIAKDLEAS